MKPDWIKGLSVVLAACLLAGCQSQYAEKLVKPDAGYGKFVLSVTAGSDKLIEQHRIDLHQQITMADKTPIDVWVIKARCAAKPANGAVASASRGTVVVLHGMGDSKASYLGAGEKIANLGFDAVLVDLRAHGASGGKYTTYGAVEKTDVKAVMDELLKQNAVHAPIYAFGVQLGGATAIQYAAIDPRVKGVAAVDSFRDAPSQMKHDLVLATLPVVMSEKDINENIAKAGEIAHFKPESASPLEAVKTIHAPILLVHGASALRPLDLISSQEASNTIYDAANDPRKLLTVTPGPEQAALAVIWDAWIADRMDEIASGKIATGKVRVGSSTGPTASPATGLK